MNDSSGTTSTPTGSRWIAHERGGKTTVVTYTEYEGSFGSVRTSEQWPSALGSGNFLTSAEMRALIWALLFTSDEASQMPGTSTQRSHSGCWCNSSRKRGTSDVQPL